MYGLGVIQFCGDEAGMPTTNLNTKTNSAGPVDTRSWANGRTGGTDRGLLRVPAMRQGSLLNLNSEAQWTKETWLTTTQDVWAGGDSILWSCGRDAYS